jgi:hypothetical protein
MHFDNFGQLFRTVDIHWIPAIQTHTLNTLSIIDDSRLWRLGSLIGANSVAAGRYVMRQGESETWMQAIRTHSKAA